MVSLRNSKRGTTEITGRDEMGETLVCRQQEMAKTYLQQATHR